MDAKVVTAPTELLPCPFCGGNKARTIHIRDGRKVACICGACGKPEFHGPLDKPNAESRAVAAWNARAVSAAEGDLLGRCVDLLGKFAGCLHDDHGVSFPEREWCADAKAILSQVREVRS